MGYFGAAKLNRFQKCLLITLPRIFRVIEQAIDQPPDFVGVSKDWIGLIIGHGERHAC